MSLKVLDGHTHTHTSMRMRIHSLFVPPAVKPQWEERVAPLRNWTWLLKIIGQIARRHATTAAVTAGYSCCAMWGHPWGDQREGKSPAG